MGTFKEYVPLKEEERNCLLRIAERLKDSIPCTSCKYCIAGCPKHLNIPMLIDAYNDMKFNLDSSLMTSIQIEALDPSKLPSNCIKCGKCTYICPQKINVPTVLENLNILLDKMPKWADVCKKREEETKKIKLEVDKK